MPEVKNNPAKLVDELRRIAVLYETTCLWAQVCLNGYGKATQVGDSLRV